MDPEIHTTIQDFNDMLLSLARSITKVCPNSIIGTNIREIEKMVSNTVNFKKFIELFAVKVLPYKSQIDTGDESYFMSKDYTDDVGDSSSSTVNQIISLKSVWKELKPENKQIVIFNMQCLCELALDYAKHVQKQM